MRLHPDIVQISKGDRWFRAPKDRHDLLRLYNLDPTDPFVQEQRRYPLEFYCSGYSPSSYPLIISTCTFSDDEFQFSSH